MTVTEVTTATLEMRSISKRFGRTVALDAVDMTAYAGSVHALVGENGAGKTTLMQVLAGLYQPDTGSITVAGRDVRPGEPSSSVAAGIGIVHQHVELIGSLTAIENIALGAPNPKLRIDLDTHRRSAEKTADQLGFAIHWQRRVSELEVGEQQRIEILRVLHAGAKVLVLDEPTTHLAPVEADRLFDAIRILAAGDMTVIVIAHKPAEVLAVSDHITVLRQGRKVADLRTTETDAGEISRHVLGGVPARPEPVEEPSTTPSARSLVLQTKKLSATTGRSRSSIDDVDIEVVEGSIIGVAGVTGNGQTALVEAISGITRVGSGTIRVGDRDVTRASAAGRIRAGVVTLPADRTTEGVLPGAPLWETFALGRHLYTGRRWRPKQMRREAREMIELFGVVADSERTPTANLSGGNIQRVLVARALSLAAQHERAVLVAANPTAGLDIGATRFVHAQLRNLRASGGGILLLSEDRDELVELCDGIVVLSRGRIVGRHRGPRFDLDAIGAEMLS